MEAFLNRIVSGTEAFLTWRKRRRWEKKEKQKQKNPVLDWLDALIWAAFVVLLVNQYLFQAYAIPTGSMKNTLLEQDRIFVNKLIFGPELLPGIGKLPGFDKPHRGNIIIFENPLYESKGPVFDIAQRFIYMVTLSLVDIDANSFHFLIKREVGSGGDWLRLRQGELEIRPQGEDRFIPEREFEKISGLNYQLRRLHPEGYYPLLQQASRLVAWKQLGLDPQEADQSALDQLAKLMGHGPLAKEYQTPEGLQILANRNREDQRGRAEMEPMDEDEIIRNVNRFLYEAEPQLAQAGANFHRYTYHARSESSRATFSHVTSETGQYLPPGWILPLGDNRDNSRDGRVWGPISEDKVLGQAAFRYWPLGELGGIH